jgi:hypothetical protein
MENGAGSAGKVRSDEMAWFGEHENGHHNEVGR